MNYPTAEEEKKLLDIELGTHEITPKRTTRPKWALCFMAAMVYLLSVSFVKPVRNMVPSTALCAMDKMNPLIMLVKMAEPIVPGPTPVFEVVKPVNVPLSAYTVEQTLFNETSFLDAVTADFSAPEVFNVTGGVMTLNVSTSGAHVPVVAEVAVGGYPVWRFSTPNPLGLSANSSNSKNITDYLSLFEQDQEVSVSLIEGPVAGNVNVSLGITLYNDTLISSSSPVPAAPIDISQVFSTHGPANYIQALTKDGKPFQIPQDSFSATINQLPGNVTVAKLVVWASASKEEVAYFRNAITNVPGTEGTGPLRTLNVYVDSVLVSIISPNPALFNAHKLGMSADSSKLWSPVAASGSFNAIPYEVDLTSVLPLLWETSATVSIEVVSPVKVSTVGTPSLPGPVIPGKDVISTSGWDLSANLLAWSSEFVASSVGALVTSDSLQSGTGILIQPPMGGITNQIVRSGIDAGVISQLNLTLVDGTTHNFTSTFNSSSSSVSVKTTRLAGAVEGLSLIDSVKENLSLEELVGGVSTTVLTRNSSIAYPLVLKETLATLMPPMNASLEVSLSSSVNQKVNKKSTLLVSSKQNSTIDALTYSTDTSVFEVDASSPVPFSRKVTAENGIITKDSLPAVKAEDVMSLPLEELAAHIDFLFSEVGFF